MFLKMYCMQYKQQKAGFKTVGIYDTSSEKDWETIKKTADIFLEDLHDFSSFWKQIS